mgnify:CR=1 FL=1
MTIERDLIYCHASKFDDIIYVSLYCHASKFDDMEERESLVHVQRSLLVVSLYCHVSKFDDMEERERSMVVMHDNGSESTLSIY